MFNLSVKRPADNRTPVKIYDEAALQGGLCRVGLDVLPQTFAFSNQSQIRPRADIDNLGGKSNGA
jgi:hypothetical protein